MKNDQRSTISGQLSAVSDEQPVERDTSVPDPELASSFLGAVQQWWLSEMVKADAEQAVSVATEAGHA